MTQASPATVSRCGMIYMEPSTLGWKVLVESWITAANPVWMEENKELFADMFEWLIPPCLLFVKKHGLQICTGGVSNLVKWVLPAANFRTKSTFIFVPTHHISHQMAEGNCFGIQTPFRIFGLSGYQKPANVPLSKKASLSEYVVWYILMSVLGQLCWSFKC